jgi:OFA family oxalate/formate antiporter-like MFS transporter
VLPISRQVVLVAGCCLGLACGFAGLYFCTLPIFLKPIALSLGWSRADVSAAAIMSMLGLAIGAPFQGYLIDRWGARRIIGASVAAFALALFGFSVLPNNRILLGALSLAMGALTVATGPSGYLSVLPRWFDRRLGLALSCAMVGVGLGAMIMPKVAQGLIQSYGWREAYRAMAAIALGGGAVAYALLNAGELDGSLASARRRPIDAVSRGVSLGSAVREPRFWVVALIMAIGGAGGLGFVVHLVALLDDRGISPAQAATAAAVSGVGVLLGRLIAGALMDYVRVPLLGAIMYLCAALGAFLVLMNFSQSYVLVAIGALLVGLAVGAEGDFVAFAVRRYFGMKSFAGIYGCLLSAYSVGGVVGPVLFGASFDHLGNYRFVLELSIAGFLLNTVLVLTLGRYRYAAADSLEH